MELMIKEESLKLSIESEDKLTFEQLFGAYQLVTGGTETLKLETKDDGPEKDGADVPEAPFEYFEGRQERNAVKVDVDCPECGNTNSTKCKYGFSYIYCPVCRTKLYLAPAGEFFGERDEKGFMYKANTKFLSFEERQAKRELEEMFTQSNESDGDTPTNDNTISEIINWLDDHKISHTGIKLKGDLLNLVKQSSIKTAE